MSPFEILMLICFGAAWPLSIYKLLKSKSAGGKSIPFLLVLILGYIAGVLHKCFYSPDPVVALYGVNLVLISIDLFLVLKYRKLAENSIS